jgi:hypothetical protein
MFNLKMSVNAKSIFLPNIKTIIYYFINNKIFFYLKKKTVKLPYNRQPALRNYYHIYPIFKGWLVPPSQSPKPKRPAGHISIRVFFFKKI